MQHAGKVHVIGALPAAHQIFQFLGGGEPIGPPAGLSGRIHLREQGIKVVAALGKGWSGKQDHKQECDKKAGAVHVKIPSRASNGNPRRIRAGIAPVDSRKLRRLGRELGHESL
ncbi:hypothetical protein ACU4GH_05220 [Bradyrhizobium betae]